MDDIMDTDIYELLNIPSSADERMVKKAYRKKALQCHPDKNPDNPQAALLFLELTKALEVLLDRTKRDAYDKLYNGRKAAKIRHQQLDSQRKKFKEELEFKERLAHSTNKKSSLKTPEQKLSEEIERLRKEGSEQLKEEMESLRNQIHSEKLAKQYDNDLHDEESLFRLKIRWKSEKNDTNNGGYDSEHLTKIFSKYGSVAALIVSQKKNGSALIEFDNCRAAVQAYQLEKGYPENPLKLSWLNGEPSLSKTEDHSFSNSNWETESAFANSNKTTDYIHSTTSEEKYSTHSVGNSETDFESLVFAKLREAEEKKKHYNNV